MNYHSDDFDPAIYLPAPRRTADGTGAWSETAPTADGEHSVVHPRQPNLGFGLIAIVIGLFLLAVTALALPDRMPGASVLGEGVGYLLALAIIIPLFRRMWQRPFNQVLQVSLETARRHAGKLMVLGAVVAALAQVIESHMTFPKKMPIDTFFQSTGTVWIVAIFGTLIGPIVEELIFRGFLMRGFAIAFDWLRYPRTEEGREAWKSSDAISRPAWIFSAILTSILFAAMHAAQLGKAWNAVAVLTLVGGVLAAVRLRFNSLAASCLVHIAYNGFIFVVLFFATDGFRHLDKMHGR